MRVFAFQGLRYVPSPKADAGAQVAPPYDQIGDALRDKLHASSPVHFSHLIRPVPGPGGDPYQEAARLHRDWLAKGVIRLDEEPSLYPYAIRLAGGGERLGLTALVGLEEPQSGIIRAHEQTLDKPLADRLKLLDATRVDLEPVLLLPDDGGALDRMLAEDVAGQAPLAVHTDGDGHRHAIFRVKDPARIRAYQQLLAPLPAAIADGHHRYKTAQLFAREHEVRDGAAAAKLAVITSLAAQNLTIDPIHRALPTDPGIDRLYELVRSRQSWSGGAGPEFAAAVAAAPGPALGVWRREGGPEIWQLDPGRAPSTVRPAAARLTVVLLHDLLFPALGFQAAASTDGTVLYRSDPRELHRMLQSGEVAVGIFLPPMLPAQFAAAIADGDLLPPKSTRFLPKVFSGLVWAAHASRLA